MSGENFKKWPDENTSHHPNDTKIPTAETVILETDKVKINPEGETVLTKEAAANALEEDFRRENPYSS